MKRVLVIDDLRNIRFLNKEAEEGKIELTYARTLAEGLEEIQKYDEFHELWLDHDLGGPDKIGPVVELLEELAEEGKHPKIQFVYVHSDNPAADALIPGLERVYRHVTRCRINLDQLGIHHGYEV